METSIYNEPCYTLEINGGHKVVKSNYLVKHYENYLKIGDDLTFKPLTKLEIAVLSILISAVNPEKDTDFKFYKFNIKEFAEKIGLKSEGVYQDLRQLTLELKTKVAEIKTDSGVIQVSWLGPCVYNEREGTVQMKLSEEMKPFLLNLKRNYSDYELKNILNLSKDYIMRIYDILKSDAYKSKVVYDFDTFKRMVGVTAVSYKAFPNFKQRILDTAKKEIEEKTDIRFEFEGKRTGKKIDRIEFYKIRDLSNEKENKEKTEEIFKLVTSVIVAEKIDRKQAKSLYKLANGNIEVIKEKYEILKMQKSVDNVFVWMKAAISENYQKPVGYKKVDDFNKCMQRDIKYDGSDIERKLLGWDDNNDNDNNLKNKDIEEDIPF